VKKPKYVFDRADYINIGGGSAQIGANKVAYMFNKRESLLGISSYDLYSSYEMELMSAFSKYNPGWRKGPSDYGNSVIVWSTSFEPTQSVGVFK